MHLIAGMYIRDGGCVLPTLDGFIDAGEEAQEPAAVARALERAGAGGLQVIDVDGESAGHPVQHLDMLDVLMAVSIPVQVGGGLCTPEDIGQVLSRGAARAVVQVSKLAAPRLADLIVRFGDRLVVAIELHEGHPDGGRDAATAGSAHVALAARLKAAGAPRLLCRSGSGPGVSWDRLRARLEEVARVGPPVLASGGIDGLQNLVSLARVPNVEAAVVSRALLEGTFTVAEGRAAIGDL